MKAYIHVSDGTVGGFAEIEVSAFKTFSKEDFAVHCLLPAFEAANHHFDQEKQKRANLTGRPIVGLVKSARGRTR